MDAHITSIVVEAGDNKLPDLEETAIDTAFLFVTLLHYECRQRLINLISFLQHLVEFESESVQLGGLHIEEFAQCFVPEQECRSLLKVNRRFDVRYFNNQFLIATRKSQKSIF